MDKAFGDCLRDLRVKAGFGLRAFAKKIGMQPSNLSLIENGKANPPRDKEILFTIARALGLEKGSADWGDFFDSAVKDVDTLPADIADNKAMREMLPIMLRTVANEKLSRDEILKLIKKIRENK